MMRSVTVQAFNDVLYVQNVIKLLMLKTKHDTIKIVKF